MSASATVLAGLAAVIGISLLVGCGGSEPPPKSADDKQGPVMGLNADDQSRCDYEGRDDREVKESAGPGSITPNIRRVYAILGTGEDRRRILQCREVDTNLDGTKDVVRTYTDKGEKLNELSDSDYDGRIDTWVTFAGGHIAKVELDKRGIGKPTEWRFYNAGRLSRVQRDTNGDGKPDAWEIYAEGRLQRMGVDLDHDGRVDRWDRDEVIAREEQEKEQREAEEQAKKQAQSQEGAAAEGGETQAGEAPTTE